MSGQEVVSRSLTGLFHTELPGGSSITPVSGPPFRGELVRSTLSGVVPTPIARVVRTPSPTARLSAGAGSVS